MIILQCKCGATIERKYRSPRACCRACKNASYGTRRMAARTDPEYKRNWYRANKDAVKLTKAFGFSMQEARRRLTEGRE